MHRANRRALIAAFLAVTVLAACSTPASSPTTAAPTTAAARVPPAPTKALGPLVAIVRAATEATIAAGSASVAWSAEYQGSTQYIDGIYGLVSGRTTFGDPRRMAVDVDYPAPGPGQLRALFIDDLLLLRGAFLDQTIDPGKWLVVDTTSEDSRVDQLAFLTTLDEGPEHLLYGLYGATERTRSLGAELLDGQRTSRYLVDLDFELASDEVPEAVREWYAGLVAASVAEGFRDKGRAEIWIDEAGHIVAADGVSFPGPDLGNGQLILRYRFSDFGAPIEIPIPDDEDLVYLENIPMASPMPSLPPMPSPLPSPQG